MTKQGKACRAMIEKALAHYELPASESALRLLCMVAAHESGGFFYTRQVGGPALSLFQMEPRTFRDVLDYCLRKHNSLANELPCEAERLVFDPPFAAAMSRVFFMRFPEPLPPPADIPALAAYAKTYWNTEKGKATAGDYANAWGDYFED